MDGEDHMRARRMLIHVGAPDAPVALADLGPPSASVFVRLYFVLVKQVKQRAHLQQRHRLIKQAKQVKRTCSRLVKQVKRTCSSAITSSIDSTGMISMPGTEVSCVSICAFVLVKQAQWRSICAFVPVKQVK